MPEVWEKVMAGKAVVRDWWVVGEELEEDEVEGEVRMAVAGGKTDSVAGESGWFGHGWPWVDEQVVVGENEELAGIGEL